MPNSNNKVVAVREIRSFKDLPGLRLNLALGPVDLVFMIIFPFRSFRPELAGRVSFLPVLLAGQDKP